MYDTICRDCVISKITWLKEHNPHYADIKLNKHWYSHIASRELSVQLSVSDNCITVTEDTDLNQSLQNENINKEKLMLYNILLPINCYISNSATKCYSGSYE